MGIKIDWNEDKSKAIIAAEDLEALQNNFDKGYAKGTEKGRKEATAELLKQLEPLKLDPENLAASLDAHLKEIKKLREEYVPPDKIKDSDAVKNLLAQVEALKKELADKSAAHEKLSTDFGKFKEETLIDRELIMLANNEAHKAINPRQAMMLFKADYKVEIGEGNKLLIKNSNGTPMFNQKGEEMAITEVFAKFSGENGHLFAAKGSSGGSGGGSGPGGTVPAVKYADLKTDADKAAFVEKHGLEAYQKMLIGSNSK